MQTRTESDGAIADGAGVRHRTTYRVVILTRNTVSLLPDINDEGQVAYTEDLSAGQAAMFYDGTRSINLGTLGGTVAIAAALNDLGQVAGSSSYAQGDNVHPFRWTPETGMVDLNPSGPSLATGAAFDINNFGQVVGYIPFIGPVLEPFHAFRWSPDSGLLDLGTLNGHSLAIAINDAGQVAGESEMADGNAVAIRWTEAGGMVSLGTLGGADSRATAINEAGQVAGHSRTAEGAQHAFLWSPDTGMVDLGALGTGGNSSVNAINDQGWAVGSVVTPEDEVRAYLWRPGTGMIDLGSFGASPAIAHDVNNAGQVVGSATTRSGRSRAFIWTEAGGMVDLNRRIPGAGGGLRLSAAVRISDNGSIVAHSSAGLVLLVPRR